MAQNDRGTISLITTATPALTLGGIIAQSLNPNLQEIVEASDGQVDPTFTAVMSGAPAFGVTTVAVATALAAFGINGTQAITLAAYLQKIAAYGTRSAGATHMKIAIANALMVPRQLTAAQGQRATLALEAFPVSSDGETAPVEFTDSQVLPAGGGVAQAFTLGPVSINGAALDAESVTVDPGLDARTEGSEGDVWTKLAYVMNRRPTIRIRTPHRLAISDFGLAGAAQGASDSLVYLRKLAANGTRVAENVAEHIKIAVDDGRISCQSVTGSQGEILGSDVVITPVYDGTAAILAIDTASAIT